MQKTITKFLILTIILTAALGVNYLFAAWTGPTQAPPRGNTPAPIHVGSTNQVKDGGLSVDALSVFGSQYVQGTIQVGNSGISPQAGTIRWTGLDFEGYMGGSWISLTGAALSPTCTSFTYSAWGACQPNGTQTRSVISSSPDGCVGGDPVIVQSCTYTLPMSTQCQNVGGSWMDAQGACYFLGGSCPSGWSKKELYSSTEGNSGSGQSGWPCNPPFSCSTGSHYRSNAGIESCTYNSYRWKNQCPRYSVSATQTEVGCTKN